MSYFWSPLGRKWGIVGVNETNTINIGLFSPHSNFEFHQPTFDKSHNANNRYKLFFLSLKSCRELRAY